MGKFKLTKWYLDVADEKGNVYIGYRANLKWGAFAIDAAHYLWRVSGLPVQSKMCLGEKTLPKFSDPGRQVWRLKGFAGVWESTAAPIKEVLYKGENGKIVWECRQPKASAKIEGDDFAIAGFGYTERIDITVPVWELPFDTLYWGRCHTKNHWLVWIKWTGATEKNVYWFDGKREQDIAIDDAGLFTKSLALEFGEKIPLRQGIVAATVFAPAGALLKALPAKALHIDENKWHGSGKLKFGGKTEKATIIYEKVTW